jgi:hypothetical protein
VTSGIKSGASSIEVFTTMAMESGNENRAEPAGAVDIILNCWKFSREILQALAVDLGNSGKNCRRQCRMSGFCCRTASRQRVPEAPAK